MCARQLRERHHQRRQILSWLYCAERENIGRRTRPPIDGRTWPGRKGPSGGVETGRHDPDPVTVDTEQLEHLVAHEARENMHESPMPDRPRDEPGVGQRSRRAELRIPPRGQVVDRHDPAGTACRGHDVVGPVHHVDGPDEPFDRWEVSQRPRRVGEPRRGSPGPYAQPERLGGRGRGATGAASNGVAAQLHLLASDQRAGETCAEPADPGDLARKG